MTDLFSYEDKLVRVTDQEGRKITGTAVSFPSGYGLHEYNREEEGLQVGEYVLFKSQIAQIECLPTYEEAVESIQPGRYRHFKGKEYECLAIPRIISPIRSSIRIGEIILGIARHSETEEAMVVYRPLYTDHGLWVRPASMWNEEIERDGKTFRRFERIGD